MCKLVEHFLEPTCIHIYDVIFFSNRSICCISSLFEGNNANRPIRTKQSSTFEKIKLVKTLSVTYFFTLVRIHSANSHGEFGEFARRRGAAHRQRFWHAACIGSWQVHTISRFVCMARRIRGANSHGVPAPRRRGAAHRHPPPTANGAAQRERQGEFTARSWPQLLMWARCHTAAR